MGLSPIVRWRFALAFSAVWCVVGLPARGGPDEPAGPPNRLAKESSPYLLQHAHNPVDWYPWGPEAFEKARKEKKLIFLSIGYSSCHWCHVMERESFANKQVAALLNKHFVCIKVDREERPDVDDVYMNALQVMGARGGWPLSMFLMPDGKPIIGGTYWPREDREADGQVLIGFKSVLGKMVELHRTRFDDLQTQADHFAERTRDALESVLRGRSLVALDRALVTAGVQALRDDVDPVFGGIGNRQRDFRGTKFPMPAAVGLLLSESRRSRDKELAGLVSLTLRKMATGGIYDQLGGGFHRYSTERTWTVPHFEKMLYDNAQLVELYARAYAADAQPLYRAVVDETLAFVRREMTSAEGAFYSALDADSEGAEGEFYVWTPAEFEKTLGKDDAELFRLVYGMDGDPTFEQKAFVLHRNRPLADIAGDRKVPEEAIAGRIGAVRAKLLAARDKRKRPLTDTKIIAGWNGQMIGAYALAGKMLKEAEYTRAAEKAADFVLANLVTSEGRLARSCAKGANVPAAARPKGYLDDYAFVVHGFLNLHDATGSQRWLDEAKRLTEQMVKWHGDGDRGGFFYTPSDHEKLFARPKDYHDGAQPSGNGVAVANLVRLAQKTGDGRFLTLAEKSLQQFAGILKLNGQNLPTMVQALSAFLDGGGKTGPEQASTGPATGGDGPGRSDSVVKVAASATAADPQGVRVVTARLTVEKPWHIYANPVANDTLQAAQTTVRVFLKGKELTATVEYPKGKTVKDTQVGDYLILEGEVEIRAKVTVPASADGPLEVAVRVQACTEKKCLVGATLKSEVK